LAPGDLAAGYRSTALQSSGEIVTQATLQLAPGNAQRSLERIRELNSRRRASLPSGRPNAGSIFKNPEDDSAGRLIEAVGLKGRQRGGARISDKHANVIVNQEDAAAADVLALMQEAYVGVEREFDLRLEPEIVLVGGLRKRWTQITEGVGVT
jgi:UDP-N-acetylmuramate dehydrogenase